MKKIFTILIVLPIAYCLLPGSVVFAATPTPSKTVTSEIDQQLNNLKDKIASKVAQMNLVEKKGIIGTVTDSTSTQITLKDKDGNIHFVDVDELTKFDSSTNATFGISDVNKGMTMGILGIYNKESRRVLARFVTVLQMPVFIRGAIASIDKANFTLTVAQNDGTQTVIEIEDVTKTTSYDVPNGLVRSGFSKMHVGERVYVVGFWDKQNSKELIASRIVVFPGLAINPAIGTSIAIPTAAASVSAVPLRVSK